MNHRILVIDDRHDILQAYAAVLGRIEEQGDSSLRLQELIASEASIPSSSESPFELAFADQGAEGFALVEQALAEANPFAVAFIDIRMPPGWDGMETAARIRAIDPELEIVIVTAYSDHSRREIVEAVGAPEKLLFLRKPFDPEELYQIALSLCGKWNLARRQEEMTRVLQCSEARFRNLVEATSDWVWEMNRDGVFTYCSPLSEELYGYRPEELLGRTIYSTLFDGPSATVYRAFFESCWADLRPFRNNERQCRRKDGTTVVIESSGVPVLGDGDRLVAFRGVDRDITERKWHERERRRLEEQYRQSQKMEAIGTLASGIAHDLNNMLTPILGYSEICLQQHCDDPALHKSLLIIHQSASKAADLIRQILTFCRKQPLCSQKVDLNRLIERFMKILRRLIREDIVLEFDLAPDCWGIKADVSQVEQILLNLVINARDAVAADGRIVISTRNQSVGDEEIKDIDFRGISGDFVVLAVRDNGTGMDQETASMIFNPFFTTKEVGKGTGLGLSTVYGVVNQHQGHLRLETAPGQGTTFSIYFPRCLEEGTEPLADENRELPTGRETVLIAEDDAVLRQMGSSILNTLGYHVLEAEDGRAALKLFEAGGGEVDLLLTDLVMPGLGGEELAARCRASHPGLAIIFMSGYPYDPAAHPHGGGCSSFLAKPFTASGLAIKVRQVLDGRENREDGPPPGGRSV
ncbi:MAG: response regulator [Thermodesulfobacteriota bacterium]